MNKLKKWFFDRKVNKALIEVREELDAIWNTANRRREFMPGVFYVDAPKMPVRSTSDRNRPIEDYMKESERRKYEDLCSTEWHFCHYLGIHPKYGNSKYLTKVLGENSPPALMTVKEDRSTKLTYVYDEELDGYVPYRNGVREPNFMTILVFKDGQPVLGEDGKQLTKDVPRGFEWREAFEKNWKKDPEFEEAYKEWMFGENGIR